ncbi:hypothetical protein GCM10017608_10330 [Agromyces luteolus]|uniref:Uncharacterized protein n=1 Tax=Agromyces luteolus TaxID=88373 RepID=A0A7C9HVX3_9MICO|nr:PepSY domain-containing protein [Agromyces luteolus]MUN08565.1 hypothetical protein [Agromyces luteolus]GLK27100.1 hypothetical protein GCM10017608_10330 [Agromyces luteolus]
MKKRMIVIGSAASGIALLLGGAALAYAGTFESSSPSEAAEDSAEGPDVPITGDALERASAAALATTGGGQVTGTEVGDEESLYEVEVTLPDGSQVDVQLDESFAVVSTDADVESDE